MGRCWESSGWASACLRHLLLWAWPSGFNASTDTMVSGLSTSYGQEAAEKTAEPPGWACSMPFESRWDEEEGGREPGGAVNRAPSPGTELGPMKARPLPTGRVPHRRPAEPQEPGGGQGSGIAHLCRWAGSGCPPIRVPASRVGCAGTGDLCAEFTGLHLKRGCVRIGCTLNDDWMRRLGVFGWVSGCGLWQAHELW